jgi:hypothetical protein
MSLFGETCERSPKLMWSTPQSQLAKHGSASPAQMDRHDTLDAEVYRSLTSSPQAIPASHSHSPGSDWARRMTATYGRRFAAYWLNSDPPDSWVRTLLGTSVWASMMCYLTWKRSATPQGRLLFRLVPSTHHTGETASGFWGTPQELYPSPMPSDVMGGRTTKGKDRQNETGLAGVAKMLHTPTGKANQLSPSMITRDSGSWGHGMLPTPIAAEAANYTLSMKLNSAWVSILMGYPPDWCNLEDE